MLPTLNPNKKLLFVFKYTSNFKKWVAIKENDRQEFPGTGIGLALCRKIAEHHGGEIYAQSEEGKGAAFHVILPFKRNE